MHLHPTQNLVDIGIIQKKNIPIVYDDKGHPAVDISKFGWNEPVNVLKTNVNLGPWMDVNDLKLPSEVQDQILSKGLEIKLAYHQSSPSHVRVLPPSDVDVDSARLVLTSEGVVYWDDWPRQRKHALPREWSGHVVFFEGREQQKTLRDGKIFSRSLRKRYEKGEKEFNDTARVMFSVVSGNDIHENNVSVFQLEHHGCRIVVHLFGCSKRPTVEQQGDIAEWCQDDVGWEKFSSLIQGWKPYLVSFSVSKSVKAPPISVYSSVMK